jgi:hypothetical protein
MKTLKHIFSILFVLTVVMSCQEEDQEFGEIIAPSNLAVAIDIEGADAENPNGDGSGVVNFSTSADGALGYAYIFNNNRIQSPDGSATITFTQLGLNTYTITVIAYGTGGSSSSETFEVEVLSTYEPPAELITMLTNDSSRTWRIKAESNGHFGLGPIGGDLNSFFSAPAFDKEGVGMYDDRYIFNIDGTFTHITESTTDDPDNNPEGTVFGREILIDELGGPGGGEQNGADIENYPYDDYQQDWFLTGPGGVETLNLTGIGFMGYYIGGNHQYIIEDRGPNEMVVRSTDGNGEFDWGFILIAVD